MHGIVLKSALCALSGWLLASTLAAQTGVQVNVDANGLNIVGDAANEPTLAIDPNNPDAIVIGWRQFPSVLSDKRFAGYAYSTNGGVDWNSSTLLTPPNQPPQSGQTDPVLAVDSEGTFYYWSEVFEPTPDITQYVYFSFDSGMNWTLPTQIVDPPIDGDKPWLVIDRTGGIGDGHLYGGWTAFRSGNYMVFTRSIDGGLHFSNPERIADQTGNQFMLHFAVGPDAEVYAAWRNYTTNSIYVTKSTNAHNPAVTPTFDAFGPGGANGLDIRIDAGNDPGRLPINQVGFHQVWLGVDRTDGPRRGWVYCAWGDARSDQSDVYFARSTDGGFTWQTGTRVNDDPPGSGAVNWMIAMDVAANGRIDMTWYDTRGDPQNRLSALYYSNSIDGGFTWTKSRRLSDPFDTMIGYPQQTKIGDYNQIISADDLVNIAYAATFNGEQDIWFLRVRPFHVGDVNCDGRVDFGDINPFVLALSDPAGYGVTYPGCPLDNADINRDQRVDFGDINPFVDLLTQP